MTWFRLYRPLWILLLSAVLLSCSSERQNKSVDLASFKEHDVDVSIRLTREADGQYFLNATFTPPNGYHLYSKDIPATGVEGLGRPTLLALTPNSLMKQAGALIESEKSQTPDFEPRELSVYPSGPVTLSLPVRLPTGDRWVDDELAVTYMACSAGTCKPPVENRIVPIRIPSVNTADIQ